MRHDTQNAAATHRAELRDVVAELRSLRRERSWRPVLDPNLRDREVCGGATTPL